MEKIFDNGSCQYESSVRSRKTILTQKYINNHNLNINENHENAD